jgi:hypothetical protein
MRARAAVLVALCLSLTAACGGGNGGNDDASTGGTTTSSTAPGEDRRRAAQDALRRQFDHIDKGQWGLQWEELHPAQQAIVPKDQFIRCSQQRGGFRIESLDVLESVEERVTIPGTSVQADSVAITVQVKASMGGTKEDFKRTSHEFEVGGQWRWMISDPEPYKAGRCP